jgi:hypothetical protein
MLFFLEPFEAEAALFSKTHFPYFDSLITKPFLPKVTISLLSKLSLTLTFYIFYNDFFEKKEIHKHSGTIRFVYRVHSYPRLLQLRSSVGVISRARCMENRKKKYIEFYTLKGHCTTNENLGFKNFINRNSHLITILFLNSSYSNPFH